jgi:hypothetical protein
MSEFCLCCGEVRAEQRSVNHDWIQFSLGLDRDPSLAPAGLDDFCELCLSELGNRNGRELLDEGTDNERFEPITEAHINLFLARRLSEMAHRISRGLLVSRCQAEYTEDARCPRYAAKQLDGLWVCGTHGRMGYKPTAYRFGKPRRNSTFFVVSAEEPELVARQLRACLSSVDIEKLVVLLGAPDASEVDTSREASSISQVLFSNGERRI